MGKMIIIKCWNKDCLNYNEKTRRHCSIFGKELVIECKHFVGTPVKEGSIPGDEETFNNGAGW